MEALEKLIRCLLGPGLPPFGRVVDAGGDGWRLGGERGVEFFGAGAIASHPDVERLLYLEVLDMAEIGREFFTVMDESGNNDTVRPGQSSELCFALATKHVTEFFGTPHTGQIVAGPKRNQGAGSAQGRAEGDGPRRSTFDLIVDVDLGLAPEFLVDVQCQQGHEMFRDPEMRFLVAAVTDEDVVLVAHGAMGTFSRLNLARGDARPIELNSARTDGQQVRAPVKYLDDWRSEMVLTADSVGSSLGRIREDPMLEQLDTALAFAVVMLMLSLMITAVVQMISAVLDLRGKNLAKGLENLLRQIGPSLRVPLNGGPSMAQHIAETVVRHPAIAHTQTRAKAVSQSELISILRDLCSDDPAATIHPEAKKKLQALIDERVPGGAETMAAVQALTQQLVAQFPGQTGQVQAAVSGAFAQVSKLEYQMGQWFDTVMNRLSDIFTRTTRGITVVSSIVLVVALHIDSGEILRQIRESPDARAKLAAMSDGALLQADKTFDNGERASNAVARVKQKYIGNADVVAALDKVPPHLIRCIDGKNSLVANTGALVNKGVVLDDFDNLCQEQTRLAMGESFNEIHDLKADLGKSDLRILPEKIQNIAVFGSCGNWLAAYGVKRHLLGTLVSVLFLSLGAPFWFNALRQLSNLKPAIAGKVGGTQGSE